MSSTRSTPFGQALRQWRTLRRLSQLELASLAGTPPRHVSFLETGRARPTEGMVHRLASALDLPPEEQNGLLTSAGFSPAFRQRDLSDEALAGVQLVVQRLLASHEPYPALVVDAWYNVLALNGGASRLLAALGLPLPDANSVASAAPSPANLVDLLLTVLGASIENHAEVLYDSQRRLRRDLVARPTDDALAALLAKVDAKLAANQSGRRQVTMPADSPVLLTTFRTPAGRIDTLSAMVHFGGANDVLVHGMHVELIYPADARSDELYRQLTKPPV